MSRLYISVHKCNLLRGGSQVDISPCVEILVDKTYKFCTDTKQHDHKPKYEETFVIDNTHRLAVIEVSVYDMGSNDAPTLSSMTSRSTSGGVLAWGSRALSVSHTNSLQYQHCTLIGHCYLSVQRLTQKKPKTRTYVLAIPPKQESDLAWLSAPTGLAGTITITLYSDFLGEPAKLFLVDDALECEYAERVKRLLLRYDKSKLQVLDLIFANVRDPSEQSGAVPATKEPDLVSTPESPMPLPFTPSSMGDKCTLCDSFYGVTHPSNYESFDGLISRLCSELGGMEPRRLSVSVCVLGYSGVASDKLNTALIGSDSVYVVLRTESEDFVTPKQSLRTSREWSSANKATLDVLDPLSFVVQVLLVGESSGKPYVIGRTTVSAKPLALNHTSLRNMFLCSFDNAIAPTITGLMHLELRTLDFGLTSISEVHHVDDFYNRLSKFFKRYNPTRVPQVDMLVCARQGKLEELMQDLVMEYGCEPGTVRLRIIVEEVLSLRESATVEIGKESVRVIIAMGGVVARTKAREVRRFAITKFGQSYWFDVVRETDLIRVEVVKASNDTEVYGRVDFSCLKIQREVPNCRMLYLVGNAGSSSAYISGLVKVNLFSSEVGLNYEVDERLESMYVARLRRYTYRHMPESLHRVNVAMSTIFDMESFMAALATKYGEENTTYAIYCTILGCRQLQSRISGINPYVVVRLGVDSYHTKVVKRSTEPDFFEYTEFYCDQLSDTYITLVVMDHSEIGQDREIGHTVLCLKDIQVGHPYNNFLPLHPPSKKHPNATLSSECLSYSKMGRYEKNYKIGLVGFKFTVVDLGLVDKTCTRLVSQEHAPAGTDTGDGANQSNQVFCYTRASNVQSNLGEGATPSAGHFRLWGLGLGWMSKLRRRVARQSATLAAHVQRRLGFLGHAADSNGSHGEGNNMVPVRSNAKEPIFNLMDEGITNVGELHAAWAQVSRTSSVASEPWNQQFKKLTQQSNIASQFFNLQNFNPSDTKMRLLVRVLCCKDLLFTSQQPPNPYLLLSTVSTSHRTQMDFTTCNPVYSDEFIFDVIDPRTDTLDVSVLTDTPYGVKELGHCVLSLCNVQRDNPHIRWATLVVHPHRPEAFEHGSVCLFLMGHNFGLSYLPLSDAENRLRERLREFLVDVAPVQLHRLEWFVGEYSDKGNNILTRMFGKYYSTREMKSVAAIEVCIHSLSKLSLNNIRVEGNCIVKIKACQQAHAATSAVVGTDGHFQINQRLRLSLENPATAIIGLLVVVNGKQKVGECCLSTSDLHRGVAQERTHILVQNAHSDNPVPCGFITVSLLSYDFGCHATPHTNEEELVYTRLQRYLFYYKPDELVNADVIFSSVLNPNIYLRKMVDTFGPEPGNFHLSLTIKRCINMQVSHANIACNSSNANNCSLSRSMGTSNLFCLVRCGLDEYRTAIRGGNTECIFHEKFLLKVGLPEMEKIELIVCNFTTSKIVEVGRTRVTLEGLRRNAVNSLCFPLVKGAGTKEAVLNGDIELDLFSEDIGSLHLYEKSYSNIFSQTTATLSGRNSYVEARPTMRPSLSGSAVALASAPSLLTHDSRTLRKGSGGVGGDFRPTPAANSAPAALRNHVNMDGGAFSAELPPRDTLALGTTSTGQRGDYFSAASSEVRVKNGGTKCQHRYTQPDPNASLDVCGSSNALSSTVASSSASRTTADHAILSAVITILGFILVSTRNVLDRNIYVRLTCKGNTLFRTKPMPATKLVSLEARINIADATIDTNTIFTLKLGTKSLFDTTPLCNAYFSFIHCQPNTTNKKTLRLYDSQYRFLGFCCLQIMVPDRISPKVQTPLMISPQSMELIMDDVASVVERYTPQDLCKLDLTLHHPCKIHDLHHTLRKQLAPNVVATVYLVVHSLDINYMVKGTCTVTASVGHYFAEAALVRPAVGHGEDYALLPYGILRKETCASKFCPLRVDIEETGPNAIMTISILNRNSETHTVEIGRSMVSLRALLTPAVYDMSERLTVPLVEMQQETNYAHASFIGTLTFSLIPPAYEVYPSSLRFSDHAMQDFNRDYVRYYINRILQLMKHYDANCLVNLHARLYETYVSTKQWQSGLPAFLSELVHRWGEELDPITPVPPLITPYT